jgi:3',5'-cyclic AMP phosphodiesterase CpdA
MQFASDPAIATKIRQMQRRVRWRDSALLKRGIDQTRLVVDDGHNQDAAFSFCVIGDTGAGDHWGINPQRRIADFIHQERDDYRFILHTGDVVYLVGSKEYYYPNFIKPYQNFLVGGDHAKHIDYDQMTFNLPFFLVPGNHDYYNLPIVYGALSAISIPFRKIFGSIGSKIDFDIGLFGSGEGKAYARAFLDCLDRLNTWGELGHHLDQHYTEKTETGYSLRYRSQEFTRLPNRYYTFRYGGIDFFALDSNTFNAPLPIPNTAEGQSQRQQLLMKRTQIERQRQKLLDQTESMDPDNPDDAQQLDDCRAKVEQLEEMEMDIDKQLRADDHPPKIDDEQLNWLKLRLIRSWRDPDARGRVIFLHHPPYVTEATKWYQAQTLAIRRHLRRVFDGAAAEVAPLPEGRKLVDLVLTGHAHCMEHVQTLETGHADSHIDYIICGGSGYSLRRQRPEGTDLTEALQSDQPERLVARSHLYVGRSGHGSHKRRPYSYLRIDVSDDPQPKFTVRPFVCERYQHQWKDYALDPFVVPS